MISRESYEQYWETYKKDSTATAITLPHDDDGLDEFGDGVRRGSGATGGNKSKLSANGAGGQTSGQKSGADPQHHHYHTLLRTGFKFDLLKKRMKANK